MTKLEFSKIIEKHFNANIVGAVRFYKKDYGDDSVEYHINFPEYDFDLYYNMFYDLPENESMIVEKIKEMIIDCFVAW